MFDYNPLFSPSISRREPILDKLNVKEVCARPIKELIMDLKATEGQDNKFMQNIKSKSLLLAMLEPLQMLNLSHCQLGDGEMPVVKELLKMNSTLTSIDLSHNNINRQGARELELGLIHNNILTALNLQANPVSRQNWYEGTSAELYENKLNTIALEAIDNRLLRNQALKIAEQSKLNYPLKEH